MGTSQPVIGTGFWLTRLVLPGRFGRLFTALFIFLVVWVLMSVLPGTFGTYTKIFFAATCAYIVPVFAYISETTLEAFDGIAPELEASNTQRDKWRARLLNKPIRWLLVVNIIAVVAAQGHNSLIAGAAGLSLLDYYFVYRELAPALGSLLVWIAMTNAISALMFNAYSLARVGRSLQLDLLRPGPANSLAQVAVVSTLSIIGAQALFIFLAMDTDEPLVTLLPGFLGTSMPLLFLFLVPVWPLHQRLKELRGAELANLDDRIAAMRREMPEPSANDEGLEKINRLLVYRREIRAVSEWPFDVPALTRLAFYLVLPPLTWVGAALIENLVDAAL